MRIFFLSSWYPSRVFPTNGDFIQRHARAVALEHDVVVLHIVTDPSLRGKKAFVEEQREGNLLELIAYVPPYRSLRKWWIFYRAYQVLFYLAEEGGKADIMHVHHVYPSLIVGVHYARRHGIPCVVSEHWTGFLTGAYAKWKPMIGRALRGASHEVSCFCPVTRHLGEQMQAYGLKGSYVPVPNVVDTDLFYPKKEAASSGPFRLMHISSMKDEHKNVRGLLRVVARLPRELDWELYLIGDRPERYRDEAVELGIPEGRLHYINNLPQELLVAYLQQADLLLMFSRFENLPCVILEAFSCGVPVLSTRVGGIHEYFPEGFGRLVASEDEDAFLEELLAYLRGEQLVARPEVMHAYVEEHFSPRVVAGRFSEVYDRAIWEAF